MFDSHPGRLKVYLRLKSKLGIIAAILIVTLSACSRSGDHGQTQSTIKSFDEFEGRVLSMDLDYEIGAPGDSLVFGTVRQLIIGTKQDIYVSDPSSSHVYHFDEDGRFIRRFGSRGDGPGQFMFISGIATLQDTLYVFDAHTRRLSVFDHTAGGVVRSTVVDDIRGTGNPVALLGSTTNGLVFFYSPEYDAKSPEDNAAAVAMVDITGNPSQPLIFVPGAERLRRLSGGRVSTLPMPFGRQPRFSIGDGHLLSGSNKEFEFSLVNTNSGDLQTIVLPYHWSTPLSDQDISESLSMFNVSLDDLSTDERASIPREWPVLNNMVLTDRKSIWLQLTPPGAPDSMVLWHFNQSGEELAQIQHTDRFDLHEVRGNRLFGVKSIGGSSSVVRYSIRSN